MLYFHYTKTTAKIKTRLNQHENICVGHRHEGYPKERSFRSWSVLEVIGSHWPQYFKFVILKERKVYFYIFTAAESSFNFEHRLSGVPELPGLQLLTFSL